MRGRAVLRSVPTHDAKLRVPWAARSVNGACQRSMKQILQNLGSGETQVLEVPSPGCRGQHLLIASTVSLVSSGTERMLVEFARGSLIHKVRQQPDKVRQVFEKMRTDGVATTVEAVRSKLDQPLALGYCNVGRVLEVGPGTEGFAPGERVVSNGKHAELVLVPKNLCARIPDQVDDESAAFTILGAIALQGIRLAQPTLGEAVVVTGLGLLGLLAIQLLRANGCRVLGIDFVPARLELARQLGAEVVDLGAGADPVVAANAFSRGRGVDAVILAASTTSSEPISQAARMCRKRGRIVMVGVTGMELSRADFFEKELSFQVSCSYGPGRYDPNYEDQGHDYPFGFVRWTEQRNMEAVLDLMANGVLDVKPFITHRFGLEDAEQAYDLLESNQPSLGILIRYPMHGFQLASTIQLRTRTFGPALSVQASSPSVSFIGAGNYAGRVLIGAFKSGGARLQAIVTSLGVSGVHYGRKYGFEAATTDAQVALADPDTNAVVIVTRHDSHARFTLAALKAGKHVFVEKPLCLTASDLDAICEAREEQLKAGRSLIVMVGFNRRFAPLTIKAKQLLSPLDVPKSLVMTVNAGPVPSSHWTQDPQVGGGRLLGEACHFVDLLRHLVGARIIDFDVTSLGGQGPVRSDNATITLRFADGSFGVINYLANGHKGVSKERLEIFCAGRVLQLDNFLTLRGYGWPGFSRMKLWRQDKGQEACVRAFLDGISDGTGESIPFDELVQVSAVSIAIAERSAAGRTEHTS